MHDRELSETTDSNGTGAAPHVLGLIAGGGRLPFMVAVGARKAGCQVVCVGLADYVDKPLAGEVDVFYEASVARPGGWIRRQWSSGTPHLQPQWAISQS